MRVPGLAPINDYLTSYGSVVVGKVGNLSMPVGDNAVDNGRASDGARGRAKKDLSTLWYDISHMNRDSFSESPNTAAFAASLYNELKTMARRHMMSERGAHTLQATALVHEAYLRLAKVNEERLNREQFLAMASTTMRRVLIDHARRRATGRRGAAPLQVTLDESLKPEQLNLDVFALEEALQDLELMDARPARIVEMRVFGGLSNEEIAAVLKISSRTVKRDWILARTWLQRRLDSGRRA